MPQLEHKEGAKAAVALVTLARSINGKQPERFADELYKLMVHYIKELTPAELAVMTNTLVILAANPTSEGDLAVFAHRVETGEV